MISYCLNVVLCILTEISDPGVTGRQMYSCTSNHILVAKRPKPGRQYKTFKYVFSC